MVHMTLVYHRNVMQYFNMYYVLFSLVTPKCVLKVYGTLGGWYPYYYCVVPIFFENCSHILLAHSAQELATHCFFGVKR